MQAEINGEMREVFSQREKDHMVDVLFLIKLARGAMFALFIGGAAAWLLAVLLVRRQKNGLRYAGAGYLAGAAALFAAVGIVVLLASRDFTAVFVKFHEIFFTNDLWLLNWDDMLIMMVPEPFFVDCAVLIAIVFAVGLVVTGVLALVMLFARGKKSQDVPDKTLTAVSGSDGDQFFKISEEHTEDRPDADEIFARLGLEDQAEDEEEPFEIPVPVQPAAVVHKAAPVAAEIPVRTPDGGELSVRFEMKLDLRVEKTEDGKLLLSVDPDRKPQVSLSSAPGQLSFTIFDEPAALPAAPAANAIEPSRQPIEGPVPTPEELLRQMDDLMKGFPKDSKEVDA
jgi:integral membrane protein (TIGR01906 family)